MDKKIIYGGSVDTPLNPEFLKKYLDESNDVHLLKNVDSGDLDKIDCPGVYAIDNGMFGILVQSEVGVVMGDVSNQYIDQIWIQGSSIRKRQKKNDEDWLYWSEIGVGGSSGTGVVGAVTSVNGQTGDVVLKADDVGAVSNDNITNIIHTVTAYNFEDLHMRKQEKPTVFSYSTDPPNSIMLTNNQEYNITDAVRTLILDMPSIGNTYHSNFCFKSGETPTELIYSATPILWVGDDCDSDGAFVPEANTRYEVCVKKVGNDIVARVGAY